MWDALKNMWGSPTRIVIVDHSQADIKHLAEIHGESFGRGWTDGEFEALLSQDSYTCIVSKIAGRPELPPQGFVIVKQVLDEAEIISIAVSPGSRKRGLAASLMSEVIRRLQGDRIKELILEVDESNDAALTLYKKLGFVQTDRRDSYYSREGAHNGRTSAALVMRLDLG